MNAQILPSDVYLDSSVIVAAIIGGDPHSAAAHIATALVTGVPALRHAWGQ